MAARGCWQLSWKCPSVSIVACKLLYLISNSLVKCFIGAIFVFIRSAAPTPAALGATNGLAQTMASFMRSVGPACATSLYAVSIEKQLLGGQLVYVVLLLISAVTLSASFLLPQMQITIHLVRVINSIHTRVSGGESRARSVILPGKKLLQHSFLCLVLRCYTVVVHVHSLCQRPSAL
jgi:hypothetical protein